MAQHLIINHHFFYEESHPFGKALRGPSPEALERQLQSLSRFIRKRPELSGLKITITVDDGSKSVLDVAELLEEFGYKTVICFCGASSQHQAILLPHKLNLLRATLSDRALLLKLRDWLSPATIDQFPVDPLVQEKDLYRYDSAETRHLKTALNYRLPTALANEFISTVFASEFGEDRILAPNLYLSHDELRSLSGKFDLAWHGKFHQRWSTLSGQAFADEMTPSPEDRSLLGESFEAAIPFGMKGSWDDNALEALYPRVTSAYTMLRKVTEDRLASGFCWKHRFDQVDLFNKGGDVLESNLLRVLALSAPEP